MFFFGCVCCIILIFIVYLRILRSKPFIIASLQVYEFKGPEPGPTICVIGGVHGNEPAGAAGLTDIINSYNLLGMIKRGTLRIIPRANPWGLARNVRYQENPKWPDINRNFKGSYGLEPTSQEILRLFGDADLIVDFHEGWGYHRKNSDSVGSTISPTATPAAQQLAANMVNNINKTISDNEPEKKFMVLPKLSCDIPGALSCYMQLRNRNYVLIETTGQNDIQPLDLRTSQVKIAFDTAIEPLIS
jgi:hypothetical protein